VQFFLPGINLSKKALVYFLKPSATHNTTEYISQASESTPMTEETPELNGLKWWIFRKGMRRPMINIDIITIESRIKPIFLIPEASHQ